MCFLQTTDWIAEALARLPAAAVPWQWHIKNALHLGFWL